MTAWAARLDRLWKEIECYLAFMDEAREEDWLWAEYEVWKRRTAERAKV
jgi:hypothetical protein